MLIVRRVRWRRVLHIEGDFIEYAQARRKRGRKLRLESLSLGHTIKTCLSLLEKGDSMLSPYHLYVLASPHYADCLPAPSDSIHTELSVR